MANQKIFCNVPWTNTHVYWDGSFGLCCSEKSKIYNDNLSSQYNIKNMTINEWYNQSPIKEARSNILSDHKLDSCISCYYEEEHGLESRRIKENYKSGIFTLQRFDKSFLLSNWYKRFNSALDYTDQESPIDWHIDLGNECNLCCKMCKPDASSLMASKYIKWGLDYKSISNWTKDETAWNNFLSSIDNTTRLNRIHFMGGEPMLSKRLYEVVDYLIDKKRTNISLSFVTNGTIYNESFFKKLKTFKSCDIEISLESINKSNQYIRQPGNDATLKNIKKLLRQQTENFKIVLRSVPQLLNVNDYHEYILFAWENKIYVQSNPLIRPEYLSIKVLPLELRTKYKQNYIDLKNKISQETKNEISTFTTGRDTSRLHLQLIKECDCIISLLEQPVPNNINYLETQLSLWLTRWDNEFKLNAYNYYPDLVDFLNKINYAPNNN